MPTRKIADPPQGLFCSHPDHKPPAFVVWEPGTYEHTCPQCGAKYLFIIPPKNIL